MGTIALTWLVWHQTWFGAELDDDALIAAMAPESSARDVQHGIEQITRRLNRPGADRWAALLVEASRRSEEPVRGAAAWAMQEDAGRPEFVARLREMVAEDPSPLVRRNAAGALALARDPAARPVLRSMLEPFPVTTPVAGTVSALVPEGTHVRERAPVARVRTDDGKTSDVLAPVPGPVQRRAVEDGARLAAGDLLLVLGPDASHAGNAVLGLALAGTAEDVALLDAAASAQSAFPENVKRAARRAADEIRKRKGR